MGDRKINSRFQTADAPTVGSPSLSGGNAPRTASGRGVQATSMGCFTLGFVNGLPGVEMRITKF